MKISQSMGRPRSFDRVRRLPVVGRVAAGVRRGGASGRLFGLHKPGLIRGANFPDRRVQEIDAVHIAKNLSYSYPVAHAVVAAERVEEPGGEALDGGLERPRERQADEAERAQQRPHVARDHAERDAERRQPDADGDQRRVRVGALEGGQRTPQQREAVIGCGSASISSLKASRALSFWPFFRYAMPRLIWASSRSGSALSRPEEAPRRWPAAWSPRRSTSPQISAV